MKPQCRYAFTRISQRVSERKRKQQCLYLTAYKYHKFRERQTFILESFAVYVSIMYIKSVPVNFLWTLFSALIRRLLCAFGVNFNDRFKLTKTRLSKQHSSNDLVITIWTENDFRNITTSVRGLNENGNE